MSPDENARALKAHFEKFSKRDMDGLLAPYNEKSVVIDHALQLRCQGIEQVRAFYQEQFDFSSDQIFEISNMFAAGEWVCAQTTAVGTHDGVFAGHQATHKPYKFSFCNVVRYADDGMILEDHVYYDLSKVASNLWNLEALWNVFQLPPPESRGEH